MSGRSQKPIPLLVVEGAIRAQTLVFGVGLVVLPAGTGRAPGVLLFGDG